MKQTCLLLAAMLSWTFCGQCAAAEISLTPNIVYILCDDLGYGDVHCLGGETCKIATPKLDELAAAGMIFTDAHSGSSVCTPTRYGILTGRYAWRTRLQNGVLYGFDKPLIAADRLTVPALLKQHGYATACIGKWHLGMDITEEKVDAGPTTRGFDYYYGISASLDMPPYAFIENDRYTQPLTTKKKWLRKGPASAGFEAVDVLPKLTQKTVEYIGEQAKAGKPFFVYLALNSPHTPIVPTDEWKGKSGLNAYGDFVMQTDAAIGEVLAAIDAHQVRDNTLVVVTSDNGCSPAANIEQMVKKGHLPSANRRGSKADIWDGGHRVPFIARWPAKIKPGTSSDQVICLTDLMATCSEIVGAKLPENAGEDSVSILPALLGTADKPLREATVHHSIQGAFAIRQGQWKLELCRGSGGWSKGNDGASVQLYDMASDVGETSNRYEEHPEIVEQLTKLMKKYIADGRSTPGAAQKNDVAVKLQKKAN